MKQLLCTCVVCLLVLLFIISFSTKAQAKMRLRTDFIIIHSTATKPSQDIGRAEIDLWHRKRGFFKVGYHYIIRRNGTVETGREIDESGAHCRGYNYLSIGVALVGGLSREGRPEDNFTDDQKKSLEKLLLFLIELYPNVKIEGHRDVANTDCPSFNVREWLKTTLIPVCSKCKQVLH